MLKSGDNKVGHHLSELIKKSGVVLCLKLVAALSAFMMSVLAARHMGADQSGMFFLGFSLLNILAGVSRLGFDRALVRYVAIAFQEKSATKIDAVVRHAVHVTVVISLLLGLVLWGISGILADVVFEQSQLQETIKVVSITILPFSLVWLFAYVNQGMSKVKAFVFFLSISIPSLTVFLMMVYKPILAESASRLLFVSSIFFACVAVIFWQFTKFRSYSRVDETEFLARFKSTARNMFSVRIITLILQWGSPLLVGFWMASSDVALFSAAQRTAMMTSMLLVAVNAVVAPNFAKLYEQGDLKELRNQTIASTRMLMVFGGLVLAVMIIVPDKIMGAFGSEFDGRDGVYCLVILAIGQYVNTLTGSVGNLLQMTGNESLLRNNLLLSLAILILGSWLVIPSSGLLGAAGVSAVAMGVQNLLGVWQVKRVLGFNTLKVW
jgi:O-antigen/teichoic acid export membrane protein